ncbi:MAG TPA: sigma-70 family RNA polymerase sigma factor [Chloroflexota bacterium]|nr:sigma-70 family RNA polymerase sigma factor [Chloroflexota bacterium]
MTEGGPAEHESELELLAAVARERDPDALARLYDLYGSQAYGLALRMLGDSGVAEEVVQEAFFRVWRNAGSYSQDRGGVRSWFLSIVHHQAVDKLRRFNSKQRLDAQLGLAEQAVQRPDVWGEVAADLERQRISQALGELPAEQRTTIELAYFGGYSHSEIANLLRIPLGTVKGRLRLGMDKLRALLAEPAMDLASE